MPPSCHVAAGVLTRSPDDDGAVHRPLRADHAGFGAARRHRAAVLRVRGVRPAAAGRPALRRGRRHRAGAGRHRDFRFDAETIDWLRSERDRSTTPAAHYLAGYRFTGDIDGYPEGEVYFPYSPLLTVSGTFAEAVVLETVMLSILNYDSRGCRRRGADGDRRGRPADHRDGLAPRARARGRRRGARGVPGRVRVDVQPRRQPAVRRADGRHGRARIHPAARRRARRLRRAGRRARAGRRRCSSTPTTSPAASNWRSRSPVPNSARSASTPATSG